MRTKDQWADKRVKKMVRDRINCKWSEIELIVKGVEKLGPGRAFFVFIDIYFRLIAIWVIHVIPAGFSYILLS
jgi:hypothetical protein